MAELMRRKTLDLREPLRRPMERDLGRTWPRMQTFREGNTMMVRAELPGIDAALEIRAATREAGEQQLRKEIPMIRG